MNQNPDVAGASSWDWGPCLPLFCWQSECCGLLWSFQTLRDRRAMLLWDGIQAGTKNSEIRGMVCWQLRKRLGGQFVKRWRKNGCGLSGWHLTVTQPMTGGRADAIWLRAFVGGRREKKTAPSVTKHAVLSLLIFPALDSGRPPMVKPSFPSIIVFLLFNLIVIYMWIK